VTECGGCCPSMPGQSVCIENTRLWPTGSFPSLHEFVAQPTPSGNARDNRLPLETEAVNEELYGLRATLE